MAIDTEEWTKMFEDAFSKHHGAGYVKGYKEGYLAAVNEMELAQQGFIEIGDVPNDD